MQLTNQFIVKAIHKKTKSRLFQDVKVGDVLDMSMTIQNTTNYGSGCYATTIYIERTSDKQGAHYSQSELSGLINRCFTLELHKEEQR